MAALEDDFYDYIIVGAGIAGTVLASRLHERDPGLSILLIEAGPDPTQTNLAKIVSSSIDTIALRGSDLDWNYLTAPQKGLGGRQVYFGGGKGIGGGSIINYGTWTRGDVIDYDDWADLVDDQRWSWKGFLPYFLKTEHHHDPNADPKIHGQNGPVHTVSVASSGRDYPLREAVKAAWMSIGIEGTDDVNGGDQIGMSEYIQNLHHGKRIVAAAAYSLVGVKVLSESLVRRVEFSSDNIATGVELADGRTISCRREVILSAGSIRSPQILMLSGIGPTEELTLHGIKQVLDAPDVGNNLWDHLGPNQIWELRDPDSGAAKGSQKWADNPSVQVGIPVDWWVCQSVPLGGLRNAMLLDDPQTIDHPLLRGPRSHLGMFVNYVGSIDGSCITTMARQWLPTSRGSVTLVSTDSAANPIVDHNCLSTEADRYRARLLIRKVCEFMNSPVGREIVIAEVVPEGFEPVNLGSTDEEIDLWIQQATVAMHHPGGTLSMGKVVDNNLKVRGIDRLRIVDASVIPCPISAPIQATIYALAEQAVDIILPQE